MLGANLDIDVINICTPNGFHADYAIKVLEAKKHVVLEKPIALTRSDERILFKSLKMSRHVFSVMQNRYSPPSLWLKEIVDNKVLGNIYMVKLDCYWNRDEHYYKREVGMVQLNWMVVHCLPSFLTLSISCIGCLVISPIYPELLPISITVI